MSTRTKRPSNRSAKPANTKNRWYITLFLVLVTTFSGLAIFNNLSDNEIGEWSEKASTKKILDQAPSATNSSGSGSSKTPTQDYDFTVKPGFAYPAPRPVDEIIRHKTYTLSYNNDAKQAWWVAYIVNVEDISGSANRKEERFVIDKKVKRGSAEPEDYKSSGYDRGHLLPAGDRKATPQAMTETFLMSNVSPQRPSLNRGVWKDIEEQVRKWVKKEGRLFITTGPVLKPLPKNYIGVNNRVLVPEYFYKVVLDADAPEYKMIGFLVPNEGANEPMETYILSVDEIEEFTGLDFYPELPDEIENELESKVQKEKWFKRKKR